MRSEFELHIGLDIFTSRVPNHRTILITSDHPPKRSFWILFQATLFSDLCDFSSLLLTRPISCNSEHCIATSETCFWRSVQDRIPTFPIFPILEFDDFPSKIKPLQLKPSKRCHITMKTGQVPFLGVSAFIILKEISQLHPNPSTLLDPRVHLLHRVQIV